MKRLDAAFNAAALHGDAAGTGRRLYGHAPRSGRHQAGGGEYRRRHALAVDLHRLRRGVRVPAAASAVAGQVAKNARRPKGFVLPAIDGSTPKQKLFLVVLLVIVAAVAWPFVVSRGTGGYRHPDADLRDARPRPERGGGPVRPAGAGLRRLLRHRRLHLRAAEPLLRPRLLGLPAAGGDGLAAPPSASCSASRCCACAATTWRS